MPFGLCNAPATFQHLMDFVLAGLSWAHCLVNLDDVIVLGRFFTEQLQNLQMVFVGLWEAGLMLKPAKYSVPGGSAVPRTPGLQGGSLG